jgi:hypothetical protein
VSKILVPQDQTRQASHWEIGLAFGNQSLANSPILYFKLFYYTMYHSKNKLHFEGSFITVSHVGCSHVADLAVICDV